MNLIERAKNILTKPKEEWMVISQENTTITQLVTGYLLILALIPAAAQFVRYGIIGYKIPFIGHISGSITYGIRQAVVAYIGVVGGAYLSAYIIDLLAPSFSSQKDFNKAMQLVVYSLTASYVAGAFYLIPGLEVLALVGGLYGLYILYLGLKPMMQTSDDKVSTYFIISLAIIIIISVILSFMFGALLLNSPTPSTF